MKAKFVRCIEGHVFDRLRNETCPTCGNPSAAASETDATGDQGSSQLPKQGHSSALDVGTLFGRSPSSLLWVGTAAGCGVIVALLAIFFSSYVPIKSNTATTETHALGPSATKTETPKDQVASTTARDGSTIKSEVVSGVAADKRTISGDQGLNPLTDQKSGPQRLEAEPQRQQPSRDQIAALTPEAVQSTEFSSTLKTALAVKRMYAAMGTRQFQTAAAIAETVVKAENPVGAFILGRLYENGAGVPLDPGKARLYYSSATRLGESNAAFALAYMAERGLGGEVDQSMANTLYLFAARNGVAGADAEIQRLGIAQQRGSTVIQAYNDAMAGREVQGALRFLTAMLDANSSLAHCAAGWLYVNGKAVQPDLARASKLLRIGAARGMTWCALGMARLAKIGAPGVPQNLIEARLWYEYVRSNGGLGAQESDIEKEIAALEQQMKPEAIAFARKIFADNIEMMPVRR